MGEQSQQPDHLIFFNQCSFHCSVHCSIPVSEAAHCEIGAIEKIDRLARWIPTCFTTFRDWRYTDLCCWSTKARQMYCAESVNMLLACRALGGRDVQTVNKSTTAGGGLRMPLLFGLEMHKSRYQYRYQVI